jgi:PAS domain S-box-containing protein
MTVKKGQPFDNAELRRRAEERLGEKTATPLGIDKEPLRLNHELQVHQIELEMQNEELHQAREVAETALEQYTDLYDFAPVGYFTLDRKGTISKVNLTGAGFVGVERSLLVSRRFSHFVTVEGRPAFNAFLEKVFTSPAKEACEVKLLREGNAPLYMQVGGVASASGQECRIALIDITERKQAEEALRLDKETAKILWENEVQLRLLVESIKDYAIFMLDVDARVITWNEGAKQLKGWDAQDVLGRNFSIFYTEEAVAAGHPEHELQQAKAEGLYKEEGWRARKDGSKFVADVTITAVHDDSGKLRGFSKVTRDITEKKLTEEALRKSEERFRALTAASSDVIYSMSPDWSEMFHLDGQDFLADTVKPNRNWLQEYIHPDDQSHVKTVINEAIRTKSIFELENRVLRVDGTLGWTFSRAIPLLDANGEIVEWFGAASDITARKRAEEELQLAKLVAEKATQAKNQFLVNMSHELRTPMTGILGMLQLALEEDPSPVLREYLETTLRSARSLLRILNDILDMAKFEAGKLIIDEKPFSLKMCIAEAIDIITPEVRRKELDIVLSVAEDVPDTVVGDQMRLRQVLINLTGNAVKFTDGGKVEVKVTADSTTSVGERVLTFAVTDTGIGIPDDKKELLFQAFSQVDPSLSRKFGGTGLGLAISSEIVELMGGKISFVSEGGKGSTFSFTIPLAEARQDSNAPSVAESLSSEAITTAQEGERIPHLLLAEDDETIRQVLGLMLKRSNYFLDIAEDGLKVTEMWEKGEYDLILMDVQMPRLSGFEATRAIREKELERGGHTPIVAMTAHASKEDEENCFAAGMDAYISKPIDFKQCLQVIGDIIKQTAKL